MFGVPKFKNLAFLFKFKYIQNISILDKNVKFSNSKTIIIGFSKILDWSFNTLYATKSNKKFLDCQRTCLRAC